MLDYAINNNLTPFVSMQNHYSLLYREEEREMMPTLNVSSLRLICGTSELTIKPFCKSSAFVVVRSGFDPVVASRSWTALSSCWGTDEARRDRSVSLMTSSILEFDTS